MFPRSKGRGPIEGLEGGRNLSRILRRFHVRKDVAPLKAASEARTGPQPRCFHVRKDVAPLKGLCLRAPYRSERTFPRSKGRGPIEG